MEKEEWYVLKTEKGKEEEGAALIRRVVPETLYSACAVPRKVKPLRREGIYRPVKEVRFPGYVFVRSGEPHRLCKELRKSREFPRFFVFRESAEADCPMFVLIYVRDGQRDALQKHFIQHGMYFPAHWPLTSLHQIAEKEKAVYASELSLVCDQRYSGGDMLRICETYDKFLHGEEVVLVWQH